MAARCGSRARAARGRALRLSCRSRRARAVDTPKAERILLVDDAESTLEVLRRNLESEGYHVRAARDVPEALNALNDHPVDLVITDIKMPKISGLELVRHIRENTHDVEVMVITGYPNVEGAVAAMKHGATDYLSKPFTDTELLEAVRRVVERLRVKRAGREALTGGGQPWGPQPWGILGESVAMRAIFAQIKRAAQTHATVLITGESGTGKELVARAIHYEGARARAPFVPVNCGAIPHELLESELFGHVKGAFSGAVTTRAGFFLAADGGTILLDELGETSPAMQVKLLRAIQEREIRMVGASKARRVDVRIIAATHQDLAAMVKRGGFREDLFFRVNVIPIQLPPLRARGDDALRLAHHFTAKYAAEYHRPAPTLSPRALDLLRGYDWPGNVRELENVIQRLVVMTEGDTIDAPDLPALMRCAPRGEPLGLERTLAEVEQDYMRRVLARVDGNKSEAARILGIDRKTLRAKLKAMEGARTP
ncbi:sigma-54 dependent transcriptional regulator [Myxococcota bacterium]|nr:sigma-54 dependent transcriptional regulator [Myxococcota bacterium]MBU1431605.1 sigma-54 dependent transcriptional regulator [Myxococcota bacterium]MBU1899641.1 sigma-54 dependent transcriptional regulator [Myxococcota bacterium]